MKIKNGLKISTQEPWYDLTDGGYLKPDEICADAKDSQRVKEAIAVIVDFLESCEEQIPDFIQ